MDALAEQRPRTGGHVNALDDWEIEDPERTLVLVACSASKLDHRAPARQLYTSDLFKRSVRWAESWELTWRVLSALHGILEPGRMTMPYDYRLGGNPVEDNRVAGLVRKQLGDDTAFEHYIVLGGVDYVGLIQRVAAPERSVWAPLQELDKRGIGYYRQWLAANTGELVDGTYRRVVA